ncbi:putative U3 small nucleolar RNA-associated protein 11 [Pseudolycoriella hygida]|uniref:U3 small nucleolar RNA-associated protein 11 n=1 Tax=Pseudolycoriella hygida TaxID=35572 RepID=A0A9Q0S4Z1_9DIPT|nr:putative U3 small nucleolar RNA-associated protein 11 [Pseudolycoriella hygida]
MSSWKKAAKTNQKTHRERHQPEARQHLGLLEKKKDYRLRAKDQHEKDDTLKLLRKRALNRNPDEFYHHMINSKVRDGEHREEQTEDTHTPEQIQLMQTQDMKYVVNKRTIESNKIKRLQAELHMIDVANSVQNRHTFFVDTPEEVRNFDIAKRLDTHPLLLDRRTNRTKLSDLDKLTLPNLSEKELKRLKNLRENSYNELKKRVEREKELTVVVQKMEMKRALQEKRRQKPKRVAAGTKNSAPICLFKYERKR